MKTQTHTELLEACKVESDIHVNTNTNIRKISLRLFIKASNSLGGVTNMIYENK